MLEITNLLISTLPSTCSGPNPYQLVIIVGLIASSGIFIFAAGASAISVAAILVPLIMSGSTISEIIAALGAAGAGGAGTESFIAAVINLVALIQQVLGC